MTYFKRIILILLFLPLLTTAQKNELMLSLSAGISNPIGEFTSTDYVIGDDGTIESEGQFAKLGGAFDFSINYRLGYYLGFAGRIMGGTNKVNTTAFSDALNTVLNESGLEATVASKGWGNIGFLAGAYFVIPTDRFYFDLRVMGGYIDLFSPAIRYYISEIDNQEEEILLESEKYNAGGFAYDLGLGVKYMFAGNKFITLNGDYVGASIKKDNIKTINPLTKEDEFVDMDVDYQNITVTLGIGYIF